MPIHIYWYKKATMNINSLEIKTTLRQTIYPQVCFLVSNSPPERFSATTNKSSAFPWEECCFKYYKTQNPKEKGLRKNTAVFYYFSKGRRGFS